MKNNLVNFCQFVNESQSKTIQALTKEFGGITVYNRSQAFECSDQALVKIFDILNSNLFGNGVDSIPVRIVTLSEINEIRKRDGAKPISPDKEFYGVCSGTYEFELENGNVVDDISEYYGKLSAEQYASIKVKMNNVKLLMNYDCMKGSNFIFTVNSLCHEMIHRYDHLVGQLDDLLKQQSYFSIKFDDHSTPTFQTMKKLARKEHIKVIERGNGMSLKDLCEDAYSFMINEGMKGKTLDVFKDDNGKWYVDMTQFKDLENSHIMNRKTRSLDMIDEL